MAEQPLDLRTIRHPQHPGVTGALCDAFSEAAEVALARHHSAPLTRLSVACCGNESSALLSWRQPDEAAARAWNNRDDTTRDGAYIISLAVIESELGLVALLRAETRSGADYYVGHPGSVDIEDAYRVEVSGVDTGDRSALRSRLRRKLDQTAKGRSDLPAYASIVGFKAAFVLIDEQVE